MKIAIYGYYNHSNAGDEAFKLVFNHFLSKSHSLHYFNAGTLPKHDDSYDCIIVGGGNLLGEYFLNPLLEKNWKYCKKKLAIGVGVSDDNGVSKAIEFNFDKIYIRNKSEIKKFPDVANVEYINDLIFSLANTPLLKSIPKLEPTILKYPEFDKKRTISFVNSLEYFPVVTSKYFKSTFLDYEKSILNLSSVVEELRKQWNINFVSISSDLYHFDEMYSRALFQACPNAWRNVNIINTDGDPIRSIQALANSDLVLSMKFHGLIFAMLNNKNVINISRNIKNVDLMELMNLDNYQFNLALDNCDQNALVLACKKLADSPMLNQEKFDAVCNEVYVKMNNIFSIYL